MFDTCTETVFALMKSCLPISPFERPSATSARISPSRAVRVSDAAPSARVGVLPWSRSRSSSGLAPSRCATSRAWSAELAGAGGVAGGAQDAGEDRADRGHLVHVAEVLEQLLGLAPHLDQSFLRRGVDPREPTGAERLGVEPFGPGPPLGAPVTRRVGVHPQHRVAVGVQPLDLGDVRRPLGRGHPRQRVGHGTDRDRGEPDPGAEPLVPDPAEHRDRILVDRDHGGRVVTVRGVHELGDD